ncbi:hypothetical protein GCM10010372_37460 [Streptomyces tauricus]|uniref:hypothetical protein n=1 Tax=Streptomyces tauricus TaxID=68274 RepID=UPI00167A08BA|nr:hypothetical protein [Streptomyces tauricus]MCW8097729.1 hypothetical protein [Streptomyces tauricus]GHA33888.1 hypothetical protein GCM10010372_37460 [Streptomyces tauricus]
MRTLVGYASAHGTARTSTEHRPAGPVEHARTGTVPHHCPARQAFAYEAFALGGAPRAGARPLIRPRGRGGPPGARPPRGERVGHRRATVGREAPVGD